MIDQKINEWARIFDMIMPILLGVIAILVIVVLYRVVKLVIEVTKRVKQVEPAVDSLNSLVKTGADTADKAVGFVNGMGSGVMGIIKDITRKP